jgi:hypothetical protein
VLVVLAVLRGGVDGRFPFCPEPRRILREFCAAIPVLALAPFFSKGRIVQARRAGFFYDRSGLRPIADLLHFDGVNLLRFIVNNPSFPVTGAQLAATRCFRRQRGVLM